MPATDYSKWDKLELFDDEDEAAAAPPASGGGTAKPAVPAAPSKLEAAEELIARFSVTEQLGEDVLQERQQLVELDKRHNENREALASLRREERECGAEAVADSKHWVSLRDVFERSPRADVWRMLEADQRKIEAERERLRDSVKRKSSRLCELDPSIAGGSSVHRSFVDLHLSLIHI